MSQKIIFTILSKVLHSVICYLVSNSKISIGTTDIISRTHHNNNGL